MELERGIAAAKTAATASGVGVKTRLQALQIQSVFNIAWLLHDV